MKKVSLIIALVLVYLSVLVHGCFGQTVKQYALEYAEDYGVKTPVKGSVVIVQAPDRCVIFFFSETTSTVQIPVKNIITKSDRVVYEAYKVGCDKIEGIVVYDLFPKVVVINESIIEFHYCNYISRFYFLPQT